MPANWADTPEKEQAWKEAKKAFKDSYGREPGKGDWATVMDIAKKIYKGSTQENTMKKGNVIEVGKEVQVGYIILEKGDKIKVIEQNSMEQLAKTIKQLLIQNRVRFKKIAYYEDGVDVALGMDYPESLFDKFWDTLESNGYSYDDYHRIISVSGDFSGPDFKRV